MHDVDDLRTTLTAQAERLDFTVSFDQVRVRARRQRTRTALVAAIVVLAVLALVVPAALFRSDGPTPTLDLSKEDLPRPEKGWRIVDDPVDTRVEERPGLGRTVLWFTMRRDGTVRLNVGRHDEAHGRVRYSQDHANLRAGGVLDLPTRAQIGNHGQGGQMPGESRMGIGLYYGEDVERIEYVSRRGHYQEGKQTVIAAELVRLSVDPNVIAYWTAPVRMRPVASEKDRPVFTLRAYDADNHVFEDDWPWSSKSDFDPTNAERLGELIRTGVDEEPGVEMVAAFRGQDGWAGLVLGRRDRSTGEVSELATLVMPMELPLGRTGPLPPATGTPLPDGRALVLGLAEGCDTYQARVPGEGAVPLQGTQTWSEDRRITVWWLVLESGDANRPGGLPGVECA